MENLSFSKKDPDFYRKEEEEKTEKKTENRASSINTNWYESISRVFLRVWLKSDRKTMEIENERCVYPVWENVSSIFQHLRIVWSMDSTAFALKQLL